ncbi:chemotaxis protein MotA [Methylomagnum ishizawai]|uniref:Chemotaxis protein MotA n=1 Tax=Methylomagnum ishizawai TaxID=1760988 RepID=A0A1Y6D3K3_9GAMM|nr:MotA/TolQ/ExbB proton channel family protein [Methylomagnum ishizawai]SMF97000.1 chemotaxis protein MotA [Methylomagnum ishizawai]
MKKILVPTIGGLVLAALGVLALWADPGGRYVNLPGLLLVTLGTLLASMLAHSRRGVVEMLGRLPVKLKGRPAVDREELETLLRVAEWHRLGRMQIAEQTAKKLRDPILRGGAEMVIGRTPEAELGRMLSWKIGAQRERDQDDIKIVLTMAGFAPALGMLGTLIGLIEMMYALDANQMAHIGTAMGFALLSTVYGLVAANLVLKPIAVRLEDTAREQLAWRHVQAEILRLLHERGHPSLIRDYWQAFQERLAGPESAQALELAPSKSSP